MLTFDIRFITGRFHATPWGRHVNEGVVEWPPSPWRFVRALVSTACRTGLAEDKAELERLISLFSATFPLFYLPAASTAHTRYFMPLYRGKRTKIFDSFVTVDPTESLIMSWPDVDITDEQEKQLDAMIHNLNYLGRSESWIRIRRIKDWKGAFNVKPADQAAPDNDTNEYIRLPCPSLSEYQSLKEKFADTEKPKSGKGEKTTSVFPADFLSALCADTSEMQKTGWSRPPGMAVVNYVRPEDCFKTDYRPRPIRPPETPRVARFAVASSVPPLFVHAISIAERMRKSLLAWSDADAVFLGREGDTPSRKPQHDHAFILPEDADNDGFIDHITVFSRKGFDQKGLSALTRIHKLWGSGGHDLLLALVGLGQPDDFAGEYPKKTPVLKKGVQWTALTPYVPAGHLKLKKRDRSNPEARLAALKKEINRELEKRLMPPLESIAFSDLPVIAGKKSSWLKFRRERFDGEGHRGENGAYGLNLIFSEPVSGPLALGYGCHFGLGVFKGI